VSSLALATRPIPSLTAPPDSSISCSTARPGGSVAQGLDRHRLRPPPTIFSRYGHLPPSFPGMCNVAHLLAAGRRSFCVCAGCDRFLRIRRMSSAIWAICRRKTMSKPAAYSRICLPSTPGMQTWAFPNLLLAKPSTCSVEGTVRCKETRMTSLCWIGDLFQLTSCAPS
jgi:hypothetical protein